MRLIKHYYFHIGTKIPFSEWPEIAHRFLSDQGLTSHRFLYYFDDLLFGEETLETAIMDRACAKILKDCPSLGQIRFHNGSAYNTSDILWLSNIDRPDSISDASILPLMKKIHRRYGFCDCYLYYYDIDFFGKVLPFERDLSQAQARCNDFGIPFDPTVLIETQPYGSCITLHRDACSDNYLELSIDLLHDNMVHDATPYFEAMQKLLPKVRVTTSISTYLTDAERKVIAAIDRSAAPILDRCRQFFDQQLPHTYGQNYMPSNYSLAKPLKPLAKRYGYVYRRVWQGSVFSLEKRTSKGNVIYIVVNAGPSGYDLGFSITYQGVGYRHDLGGNYQTPTTQQEVDHILDHFMKVMAEFEDTLLPKLDAIYPETPSWFIPSDY